MDRLALPGESRPKGSGGAPRGTGCAYAAAAVLGTALALIGFDLWRTRDEWRIEPSGAFQVPWTHSSLNIILLVMCGGPLVMLFLGLVAWRTCVGRWMALTGVVLELLVVAYLVRAIETR